LGSNVHAAVAASFSPRGAMPLETAGLNQDDQPSTSRTSEPPRRRPHRRLCGCVV